jgi:FMN-dependent NADH-azoreductase
MHILHVAANPKPIEESASKQVMMSFFSKISELNAEVEVDNIDLYAAPPPYYSYPEFRNAWFPVLIEGYVPTREEESAANYALEQAAKLNSADVLVITTPMWNYSVPSILKSWIDHVFSPGMTFTVERDGYKPLHKLKKVVVIVASGDVYKENDPRDGLSPMIKSMLQDIGVDDVAFAWADGQDPLRFKDCERRKRLAIDMAEELAEEVLELAGGTTA